MEDCIWDKPPPTPVFGTHTLVDKSSAFLTFPPFPFSGSPRITEDMSAEGIATGMEQLSQSLQGGPAVVSSPMPGWDSPNMQGGQAAVSSPMPGWNYPMACQWALPRHEEEWQNGSF